MIEKLKEIESNHDMQIEEMKKTGFVMYSIHPHDTEWLIDTIKEQQAEIDTLSMAHDDMHRLLPKDKHALIKSNIALNRRVQELEEEKDEWKDTAQSYYMTNQELREQNQRFTIALEEIIHLEQLKETNVFGYDHEDITSYVETVARKALGESK